VPAVLLPSSAHTHGYPRTCMHARTQSHTHVTRTQSSTPAHTEPYAHGTQSHTCTASTQAHAVKPHTHSYTHSYTHTQRHAGDMREIFSRSFFLPSPISPLPLTPGPPSFLSLPWSPPPVLSAGTQALDVLGQLHSMRSGCNMRRYKELRGESQTELS